MEKVIKIVPLKNAPKDSVYWMSKSSQERIDAIEFLRDQYIKTLPDAEQRFQRVCRIIRKTSR